MKEGCHRLNRIIKRVTIKMCSNISLLTSSPMIFGHWSSTHFSMQEAVLWKKKKKAITIVCNFLICSPAQKIRNEMQ